MDEIKVGRAIEKEIKKEEELKVKKALNEDSGTIANQDGRSIIITIIVLIGIFALSFGGFRIYEHLTSAAVVNIDDLHQENIAGDLDDEEGYIYNGFSFVKVDGLWWTEMDKFGTLLKVPLHFGPKELTEIEVKGQLSPNFNQGEVVHIAIDPKVRNKYYTLAVSELSFNVVKGLDRLPLGSCTEEGYGCDNRTIISCDNSQNKPVIELVLAEEPGIELLGTCIKLSGNGYDLVKAVDRLLFQWYGVMD